MKDKGRIIILSIICLVAYIAIPIFLNVAINSENPTDIEIIGRSTDWLNFWAVYLGASIPLIVLVFTIKHNTQLNVRTLQFTYYQTWIEQLRQAIITARNAFSQLALDEFCQLILKRASSNEIEVFYVNLISKINLASDAIRTVMLGKDDETEKEFSIIFEELRYTYIDLMSDIIWLSKFLAQYDGTDIPFNKSELRKYSSLWHRKGMADIRIERVAERYNFELSKNLKEILKDLSNGGIIGHLLHTPTDSLIKYELEKANNILNGTKPTK